MFGEVFSVLNSS